jgi:hypothetical protein
MLWYENHQINGICIDNLFHILLELKKIYYNAEWASLCKTKTEAIKNL